MVNLKHIHALEKDVNKFERLAKSNPAFYRNLNASHRRLEGALKTYRRKNVEAHTTNGRVSPIVESLSPKSNNRGNYGFSGGRRRKTRRRSRHNHSSSSS